MVMLNDLDRFHLVTDVIDRVPGLGQRAVALRQHMSDQRLRHRTYTRQVGDDAPDVRDWVWPRITSAGRGRHRPPTRPARLGQVP
jgi:xylulose-5-phosphate/fructose-6-phosphate phosphoketolase